MNITRMAGRFLTGLIVLSAIYPALGAEPAPAKESAPKFDEVIAAHARQMLEKGRRIFRYDTFGSEAFWGDTLKLHQAISGEKNGGVGPGVSPKTALAVGLKVDMDALPKSVVDAIKAGKVDLDDPATTLVLLQADAVVGVKGIFDPKTKQLASMGLRCAVCHSTVDDAFAPGIGHRLDGWPNRDLDVGTIVSLAPDTKALTDLLGVDKETLLKVLKSWGPGKFDASVFMDAKAMRPDGQPAAVLIPPAYGLAGVNLHTYEGWGSVPYWNAFVANLEMHGKGVFFDPRLKDAERFPIAAKAGFDNVRSQDDQVTSKLAPLHFYQLAIPAPQPAKGSFDESAAVQGGKLFIGKAKCASCHVPPLMTEPGWNMHTAEEIGIDDFQANRGPDKRYRTTPLAGLSSRQKGGFYHDGRFSSMLAVVDHYDQRLKIGLSVTEKRELIEYLKSL